MIEEIFFSSSKGNILIGNSKLMPLDPMYPVHEFNGKRLAQLKTNDVVLSVLYKVIDDFKAAKYLYDLKIFLKTKIGKISVSNISKNYIMILNELQNYKVFEETKSTNKETLIKLPNLYMDLVESVYTNINRKGEVVRNVTIGNILINNKINSEFDIKIKKSVKGKLLFKSSHDIIDNLNVLEIKVRDIEDKMPICSYQVDNGNFAYIKMKKEGNSYRFYADKKRIMKYIKFTIPVEEDTFYVDVSHKEGSHIFKKNEKIVEWEMRDYEFYDESITINMLNYNESKNQKRSITVYFVFNDSKFENISIESCKCIKFPSDNVFAKFVVQTGCYEFEQ